MGTGWRATTPFSQTPASQGVPPPGLGEAWACWGLEPTLEIYLTSKLPSFKRPEEGWHMGVLWLARISRKPSRCQKHPIRKPTWNQNIIDDRKRLMSTIGCTSQAIQQRHCCDLNSKLLFLLISGVREKACVLKIGQLPEKPPIGTHIATRFK